MIALRKPSHAQLTSPEFTMGDGATAQQRILHPFAQVGAYYASSTGPGVEITTQQAEHWRQQLITMKQTGCPIYFYDGQGNRLGDLIALDFQVGTNVLVGTHEAVGRNSIDRSIGSTSTALFIPDYTAADGRVFRDVVRGVCLVTDETATTYLAAMATALGEVGSIQECRR